MTMKIILNLKFSNYAEKNFQNLKFGQSRLSQDDYFSNFKTVNWFYKNIVVSIVFFYLEEIYSKCLKKNKFFFRLPCNLALWI